jgi:hypothetical protein
MKAHIASAKCSNRRVSTVVGFPPKACSSTIHRAFLPIGLDSISGLQRMSEFRTFSQAYCFHGRTFGIAAVTSTSRNMRPATSPSRTQSSACHQSS